MLRAILLIRDFQIIKITYNVNTNFTKETKIVCTYLNTLVLAAKNISNIAINILRMNV